MRLNGISSAPHAWPSRADERASDTRAGAGATQPEADPAPPPNVDPEFWGVLSSRERQFVAKLGGLGPLTYGYVMNARGSSLPEMRGGLVNLKA